MAKRPSGASLLTSGPALASWLYIRPVEGLARLGAPGPDPEIPNLRFFSPPCPSSPLAGDSRVRSRLKTIVPEEKCRFRKLLEFCVGGMGGMMNAGRKRHQGSLSLD